MATRVVARFGTWFLVVSIAVACGGSSTQQNAPGSGANGGSAGDTGASAGSDRGGTGASTGAGAVGAVGAGASTGVGATMGTGATGATGMGALGGTGGDAGTGGTSCGPGGCILPTDDRDPIDPPGPVFCGGVECNAPESCCLTNQICFDPSRNPEQCPEPPPDDDLWGRKPCSSNVHCGEKEFCSIDDGTCFGIGHCQPISNCGGCFSDGNYCRVCGCDGNTYPDQQTACLARTSTVSITSAGCGETVMEGGGGAAGASGSSGMGRLVTPCGADEQCPSGELCCPTRHICYPEDTPYLCEEPPEGTNAPCLTNADCRAYEYCWGEDCDSPGGCVNVGAMAEDCGITLEPVCGCDGTSYTSAACADSRGVRVAYGGECASE